jgi:hypothetical protein
MTNPYSELISKIDESTGTQIHLHCFLAEKQLRLQRRICHLLIALLASVWLVFLLQPLTGKAQSVSAPEFPPLEWDKRPAELPHDLPVYGISKPSNDH